MPSVQNSVYFYKSIQSQKQKYRSNINEPKSDFFESFKTRLHESPETRENIIKAINILSSLDKKEFSEDVLQLIDNKLLNNTEYSSQIFKMSVHRHSIFDRLVGKYYTNSIKDFFHDLGIKPEEYEKQEYKLTPKKFIQTLTEKTNLKCTNLSNLDLSDSDLSQSFLPREKENFENTELGNTKLSARELARCQFELATFHCGNVTLDFQGEALDKNSLTQIVNSIDKINSKFFKIKLNLFEQIITYIENDDILLKEFQIDASSKNTLGYKPSTDTHIRSIWLIFNSYRDHSQKVRSFINNGIIVRATQLDSYSIKIPSSKTMQVSLSVSTLVQNKFKKNSNLIPDVYGYKLLMKFFLKNKQDSKLYFKNSILINRLINYSKGQPKLLKYRKNLIQHYFSCIEKKNQFSISKTLEFFPNAELDKKNFFESYNVITTHDGTQFMMIKKKQFENLVSSLEPTYLINIFHNNASIKCLENNNNNNEKSIETKKFDSKETFINDFNNFCIGKGIIQKEPCEKQEK